MANILIIDDDRMLCDLLCRQIRRMEHEPVYALDIEGGLREINSKDFDVVYLDVNLPDGSGLDILPRIRKVPSSPEVIIFTAEGDPEGAELAIESGAWDYIEKPSSVKEMLLPLIRALQYRDEKKRTPKAALKRSDICGSSPELQECLDLLVEAAGSDENVLIMGEIGTGKELFAKAIHENSYRAQKSFVVVDCAALPDTLVESMLFGHEKGAFTGAHEAHTGLIKQADGGTLFLDEVGELSPSLQKAFLRVLQERRFRSLGGRKESESDFRLIAATNRNLGEVSESEAFRKDLFFRLNSLEIKLPPLRKRTGDIKEITFDYLRKLSEQGRVEMKGFSPEFFEALTRYDWPGNVRELLSAINRALVTSNAEPTLFPKHLPKQIRIHLARESVRKHNGIDTLEDEILESPTGLPNLKDYRDTAIEKSEHQYLKKLMTLTQKNIKEACRMSGLSRSRMYSLLKKYKIAGYG